MIVVNRPAMQATICAICGVEASVTELYQANFSIDDLTPAVFFGAAVARPDPLSPGQM
jgi:hypothetical protein